MWRSIFFSLTLLLALTQPVIAGDAATAVADTLDNFHDAASKADFDRYFGLFTDNAVFLGTDATERWPTAEFKAFTKPYFEQGKGWTYTATSRHVTVAGDGNTAWFDEMLHNDNYGECRGSGVLVKEGSHWKVAQYHLVIPVPNALAKDLVQKIRENKKSGQ